MSCKKVKIIWPNGNVSICDPGEDWFKVAKDSDIHIPSGCLGGNCGACEIEVNGEVYRACIDNIPEGTELIVELVSDPYW